MEENGRTNVGTDARSKGDGVPGANGSRAPLDVAHVEVATRLRELGRRIAPAEISDVWVFPPLAYLEGSAEFLLFTRILPDEMRRLCGAEFLPSAGGALHRNGGPAHAPADGDGKVKGNGNGGDPADGVRRITEYGAVPSHRVPRLVAGFRERLGDHRNPLHFEIAGDLESWDRLVDPERASTD
jgi:hypothetical protein